MEIWVIRGLAYSLTIILTFYEYRFLKKNEYKNGKSNARENVIHSIVYFIGPTLVTIILAFVPNVSIITKGEPFPTITSEAVITTPTPITISPNINIYPEFPQYNEIVTISIKAEINPDDFTIYVNFQDSDGQFHKYYYSDYSIPAEYNFKEWVLYKRVKQEASFRVEIYSKKEREIVYISDIFSIEVAERSSTLYIADYTEIESHTIYDSYTNLFISINSIFDSFASGVITFPDGEAWSGILHPAESKYYSYQNSNFMVTLMTIDYDLKTFSVKIQEIP